MVIYHADQLIMLVQDGISATSYTYACKTNHESENRIQALIVADKSALPLSHAGSQPNCN